MSQELAAASPRQLSGSLPASGWRQTFSLSGASLSSALACAPRRSSAPKRNASRKRGGRRPLRPGTPTAVAGSHQAMQRSAQAA
eukprot:CAMPEP_0171118274 /NCGR_PEP_ID=MMETSP0766_2-20121228/94370_1 /TAXON_ID=439317 /ORGANISM="Gambierdiscus australes, Strain CAWD 149" /LENGTH=83 /DNA_ID=CAMNT_0011580841 /DNA_START=87 /DNA_END=339 /DNA_ORIENTATION=-